MSGLQALLARHAGPAAVAAALGPEHSPLAGGAPGLRHLAACRRACLALKLHEALAPQLQVRGRLLALSNVVGARCQGKLGNYVNQSLTQSRS